MNNKAQFTPLKKAVRVIPMLYAEAFAGSNNKEFVVELYEDARLLETAAPAMYEALVAAYNYLAEMGCDCEEGRACGDCVVCQVREAKAQAEGRQA